MSPYRLPGTPTSLNQSPSKMPSASISCSPITESSNTQASGSFRGNKQRKSESDVIANLTHLVNQQNGIPQHQNYQTLTKINVSPVHYPNHYLKQSSNNNSSNSTSSSPFGTMSRSGAAKAANSHTSKSNPNKITTPPPMRKNSTNTIQCNSTAQHNNNTAAHAYNHHQQVNSSASTPNMQRSSSYEVQSRNKIDQKNLNDLNMK